MISISNKVVSDVTHEMQDIFESYDQTDMFGDDWEAFGGLMTNCREKGLQKIDKLFKNHCKELLKGSLSVENIEKIQPSMIHHGLKYLGALKAYQKEQILEAYHKRMQAFFINNHSDIDSNIFGSDVDDDKTKILQRMSIDTDLKNNDPNINFDDVSDESENYGSKEKTKIKTKAKTKTKTKTKTKKRKEKKMMIVILILKKN